MAFLCLSVFDFLPAAVALVPHHYTVPVVWDHCLDLAFHASLETRLFTQQLRTVDSPSSLLRSVIHSPTVHGHHGPIEQILPQLAWLLWGLPVAEPAVRSRCLRWARTVGAVPVVLCYCLSFPHPLLAEGRSYHLLPAADILSPSPCRVVLGFLLLFASNCSWLQNTLRLQLIHPHTLTQFLAEGVNSLRQKSPCAPCYSTSSRRTSNAVASVPGVVACSISRPPRSYTGA